jgi:alkanesulfonate monooxygenase SsuD/methylene tetrahydromethanopterin reductase-like flavin-dependent oxidoreductase (luciferase family)
MKFGVFDHMDCAQGDLAAQYADRLELIRAYDRGGLHGYHLAEHHGTPLGLAPSPSVFLAAAAQHTQQLRLGTLVYTLAQYHPLRLVEEICMLDHLSGGRFDLGIGRGISPIELSFYGLTEQEAGERFLECRDIVLGALASERLTHHGAHYRFDDVPIVMRPIQQPHPPLWYGVSKPSSCEWAAANDVNIVMNGPAGPIRAITDTYRAEWARLGKPDRELPLVGSSRHVVIADSDREAVDIAGSAYPQWWQSLQLLWHERGMTPPFISYPPTAEEAIAGGYMFAGSPASVRELISELVPQAGITYLLCRFAFGQMPAAAALRSVELFVQEVMPAFGAD